MFLLSPVYRLVKFRFLFNLLIVFFVTKNDEKRFEFVDWALGRKIKLLESKKRNLLLSVFLAMRDSIRKRHISLVNTLHVDVSGDQTAYTFQKETNPLVSIIIEADAGYINAARCLASIHHNAKNSKYELFIIDNNTAEMNREFDRKFQNITRIKAIDEAIRWRNDAVAQAKGKYILFIDNRISVVDGWLDALLHFSETHSNAVICGPKNIHRVDNLDSIHDVGYSLNVTGSPIPIGHNELSFSFEHSCVKEVDFISCTAMLIKRSFWDSCDGYDTSFSSGIFADADLCIQARERGYSVYCVPESAVVRLEDENHASTSSNDKDDSGLFYDKWQKRFPDLFTRNDSPLFAERKSEKHVVVFDSKIPSYDTNAGARSTDQYVDLLISNGFTVSFIALSKSGEKDLRYYQSKGIETIPGSISAYVWKEWIKARADRISFAFINRPHIADQVMPFLKKHTNSKIIYQGHDLHFLRLQRDFELTRNPESLKESKEIKKIEEKVLSDVDFAFYFSEDEVRIVKKEFGIDNVGTTPLFLYDTFQDNNYRSSSRRDLLFVGGFGHQPNCDAMTVFLEQSFPTIVKKINNIKIYIVGSKAPDYLLEKQSENVIFTGYLSDEQMEKLYNDVRLVVAPLRYGAGIKGKIIESMYKNVPVITTTIGAEGIPDAQTAMSIVTDMADYADSLVDLYNDLERLNVYSENALVCIKKYFSKDVAQKMFITRFVE